MNAPWRTAHKVDIQAHLSALFPPAFVRPFPDAEIEIVYGAPDEKLTTSRWFSALHIEEIVGFVEVRVDRGDNIYVGASLRKGPAPEKMRARTENFLAASCGWAEYDAAGDAERIDRILKEKQLKPAIIVTTGMMPCLRQHLYFRIKGGITDPGKLKAVNTALRDLFDSDPVTDAIRIMRLGGCINYPTEKKRERGYVTELVTVKIAQEPREYSIEELLALRPTQSQQRDRFDFGNAKRQNSFGFPPDEFWSKVNSLAFDNLGSWVPAIFPNARFEKGTGAYRISSRDLGRDLEEDLSISPMGAKDWGVWDIGDPKAGRRSAIDIVIQYGGKRDAPEAALWLCERCGVDPVSLGWRQQREKTGDQQGEKTSDQQGADAARPVDPVDLWAKFDPPTLPRGVLPDIIERFAFDLGLDMGADMAGVALSALAVCAAAIPDKIKLQVKSNNTAWLESARIWVALVGLPSTMKSPVMAATAWPLRQIDTELARQYAKERAQYDKLEKKEKSQHRVTKACPGYASGHYR